MHGRMRVRVSKMAEEIGKGWRETDIQRESMSCGHQGGSCLIIPSLSSFPSLSRPHLLFFLHEASTDSLISYLIR